MLSQTELAHWTNTFGVSDEQIRRDHLISHILAAIADLRNEIVFYGGTALSRTLLADFRLSEDIDLMGRPRLDCAQEIETRIPRALRREFGHAEWVIAPTAVREPAAALLRTEDGLSVRVQVIDLDHERKVWPTRLTAIQHRYADAPRISLTVPTPDAFAGMKILAFLDRATPRDLADLAALADAGAIRKEGVALVRKAAGWTPTPAMFTRVPAATADAWRVDLEHQMAEVPAPEDCLHRVRTALLAL